MTARPGETIPTSKTAIAAIESERKVAAVRQARRAPFFRGKLDHVDIACLDDPREWAKIPLLDKDMLRAISDQEFYRDFCLQPAAGDSIAQYCVRAAPPAARCSTRAAASTSRSRCTGLRASIPAPAGSPARGCIARSRSESTRSVR